MLEQYAKEFVSIANHCDQLEGEKILNKTSDTVTVDREYIEKLLDKYQYTTSKNKLQLWKALRWIRTDENSGQRLTKLVRNPVTKKRARGIQIDLCIAKTLKQCLPKACK